MFQHGALTYQENKIKNLVIPNLEMRVEFIEKLKMQFELNEQFFPKLQEAIIELQNENIKTLGDLIKKYHLSQLCQGDSKHSLEQDLKCLFLLILNIGKDYFDLDVQNEYDITIVKNWGQIDLLLNYKFHFEFKNIQMKDLIYDDGDFRKECEKNEFEYLTILSEKLDQENEETILNLELNKNSLHNKPNVQSVWKNLVNQTKINHDKLIIKLKSLGK